MTNKPETAAIALVIAFAFGLRYLQLNIGLPYLYFWDEPLTAGNALQMLKTGDYNPHFFKYGSLMIYLNLLVDKLHCVYLSLTGALQGVENIHIGTGWHWAISHPSFYFCNRFLTAAMGTATVFVTYLMGRLICSTWTGIASAFFLAVLPVHIAHSGFVTVDAPVALFVALTALFSILFIHREKRIYFILSLICVGFAAATKYNSGLAILLPIASLIWMSYKRKIARQKFYWLAIPTLPALTFLCAMPYAILDFPNFLKDVLHQMIYYKVTGHPGATIAPGWEHLGFQMREFYQNIGLAGAIFFLLGLAGIFSRPSWFLILLFPTAYLLFMSSMTVNFHRNFIQIYPFIAVCVGLAFFYLHVALKRLRFRRKKRAIICIVAALFLLPRAYDAYQTGRALHASRDTRSAVIDALNAMENAKKVIFAKELRVHAQDLNRLKCDYAIHPIEMMGAAQHEDSTICVLPSKISQIYDYHRAEIAVKQAIIDDIHREHILQYVKNPYIEQDLGVDYIKQNAATMLDVFSTSPTLIIANFMPRTPLHPGVIALDTCTRSPTGTQINIRNTATLREGSIATPAYELKPGAYLFSMRAKKPAVPERSQNFAFGEYEVAITVKRPSAFPNRARIRVSIFADEILLKQRIFDPTETFKQMDTSFSLPKSQRVAVKIENINNAPDHPSPAETTIKELKILAL